MTALKDVKQLEPETIYADINSHPPLMREKIKRGYLGKPVEWLVTFADGYEEKGKAHLTFHCEPRALRLVSGTVALSDYPWLKSLRADEAIRVRGRIQRIGGMAIDLDILEVSLPEPAALRG